MGKRLNLDDPRVWDRWRELYEDLSHEENIQFGNEIFARYPVQKSFNAVGILAALKIECAAKSISVLEVGGWRGDLALAAFEQLGCGITQWTNIDMCRAALDRPPEGLLAYPYVPFFPDSFKWFSGRQPLKSFDVFVSAHTIEHLSDHDALDLLDHVSNARTMILEIPITDQGQRWDGYEGTHILGLGWNAIEDHLATKGFVVGHRYTDILRVFERRG